MVKKINAQKIFVRKPEGRRPLEERGMDWRTMFKWILKKSDGKEWIGFKWLETRTIRGLLRTW